MVGLSVVWRIRPFLLNLWFSACLLHLTKSVLCCVIGNRLWMPDASEARKFFSLNHRKKILVSRSTMHRIGFVVSVEGSRLLYTPKAAPICNGNRLSEGRAFLCSGFEGRIASFGKQQTRSSAETLWVRRPPLIKIWRTGLCGEWRT